MLPTFVTGKFSNFLLRVDCQRIKMIRRVSGTTGRTVVEQLVLRDGTTPQNVRSLISGPSNAAFLHSTEAPVQSYNNGQGSRATQRKGKANPAKVVGRS